MNEKQKSILKARHRMLRYMYFSTFLVQLGSILLLLATFWLIIPLFIFIPVIMVMTSRLNGMKKEMTEIDMQLAE